MITILGSLVGLLPHLFKYWQDYTDKKQELAIMNIQLQIMQAGFKTQLQEIAINAQSNEIIALNAGLKTNIHWVDALNGVMRPLIAIIFTLKIVLAMIYPDEIPLVDHDYGIFAVIIAFYFGGLVRFK